MDTPHIFSPLSRRQLRITSPAPAIEGTPVVCTKLFADTPVVFGDSNLGRLAVNVVTNTLLAAGATPRWMGVSFTIDSDTPTSTINAVAAAMQDAAIQAEIEWLTTDTAILESGPRYGIDLTLTAVGQLTDGFAGGMECVHSGDTIIITGQAGSYGAALEALRHNITTIMNADGAPLSDIVHNTLDVNPRIHAMLYPIGGVRKSLDGMHCRLNIQHDAIPVSDEVKAIAEITGKDPLDFATADALIMIVAAEDADRTLAAIRRSAFGSAAAIIGHVG